MIQDSINVPFSRRWKPASPSKTSLYNEPLHDMILRGKGCTFETASLLHINVTNIVFWSTTTVPPPVNLLMMDIRSCNTGLASTSSESFLCKYSHWNYIFFPLVIVIEVERERIEGGITKIKQINNRPLEFNVHLLDTSVIKTIWSIFHIWECNIPTRSMKTILMEVRT